MDNRFRRIGALIPPGNVTVEREFPRFVPAGYSVHCNRLYRATVSVDQEGLLSMIRSAEQASRGLAQAGVEIIVYACTSGSFLSGPGREDEIGEMMERWTGLPACTTSTAVIRALGALRAKRVFMLTPYPRDIHAHEIEFLAYRGIRVEGDDTFECPDTVGIRDIASETVAERVLAHRDRASAADAVFVSCTNLLTMDQIEPLERELGVPVVSSNSCTLWAALTRIGAPTAGLRLGRLYDLPAPGERAAA